MWWLGFFALLLAATGGVFLGLPYELSIYHVALPLLIAYGWIRFLMVIWTPLYREEVSPGWSVALLFAAFGIFFLLGGAYKSARYLLTE